MGSILLAAAGATSWDEQQRLQGSRSLPLSDQGRAEMQALVRQITDLPVRAVYTGNSRHCLESARILARDARCRVRCVDELTEVNHGLWEGLSFREVERRYPSSYRAWLREPQAVQPPDGETLPEAHSRVGRAVQRITRRHPDQLVAIVAPRLLRAIIQCCLRGRGPEDVWEVYQEEAAWEVFSVPDRIQGKA
jgi:probable phosphoglycerate mutase